MNPRKNERNARALEMRRNGMQYKDIARELGICQSRAWLIVHNQERWEEEMKRESNSNYHNGDYLPHDRSGLLEE